MAENLYERAKDILRSRKQAYETVFNTDSVDVKIVLKDLAQFCRANETAFHEDARLHAVLEGRREVWLRIQKQLNLTNEELWDLRKE